MYAPSVKLLLFAEILFDHFREFFVCQDLTRNDSHPVCANNTSFISFSGTSTGSETTSMIASTSFSWDLEQAMEAWHIMSDIA
jgi:hypothetical protein